MRLVVLPYAGAGASAFLPWASLVPPQVLLSIVRLPGRESRFSEPPLTEVSAVADHVADAVGAVRLLPTVVFGYSLGALLAYELAQRLTRAGSPPTLLAVGGAEAPHIPRTRAPMSALPDAEFIDALQRLEGTPPEIFEHPELLALLLPTLRADFTMLDTYHVAPGPSLGCPVTTYCGTDDRELSDDGVARWAEVTSADATHRAFPGGHFFFAADPAPLVEALVADAHLSSR